MSTSQPSRQVQLMSDVLDMLASGNLKTIADALAEDFVYTPRPKSLGIPPATKAQFVPILEAFRGNLASLKIQIIQTTEQTGRAVLFLEASGVAVDNRIYENQIIMTAEYKEVDGMLKIASLQEFFDSLQSSRFSAGAQ